MGQDFASRYGPWALVAGASEGLGAAFAAALASRGLSLVLVARRGEVLASVAADLRERFSVSIRCLSFDLASPELASFLEGLSQELEIGLGVYNAAYAPVGPFVEKPIEELLRVVDVNVRGPLVLARTLAPSMVARGRGGIVLMSSLAGLQGSSRIATYAASKAFNTVLAEGIWSELRPAGVDVVVSCAGAIRTPGYAKSSGSEAPGTLDASVVAETTLAELGRGPSVVPGATNRIAQFFMGRLLPRRAAIAIMARSTKELS